MPRCNVVLVCGFQKFCKKNGNTIACLHGCVSIRIGLYNIMIPAGHNNRRRISGVENLVSIDFITTLSLSSSCD